MSQGCYGCDGQDLGPPPEHRHRESEGVHWCTCGMDWPCPFWAYGRGRDDVLALPWWRRLTKRFPTDGSWTP